MSQRQPKHKARLASPTRVKMIAAPAPVNFAKPTEEGGIPTFSALAYSGDIVSRNTATPKLEFDYILDLAGMKQGRNGKANLGHKRDQRVGHLTDFQNDGKQVNVEGLLSAETPHRDEVAKSASNQYTWELSIEADMFKPRKLAAGKTAIVNGRTVNGPLIIFAESTLTGVGFVDHGADAGNLVTIAAIAPGVETMNPFEKFCASLGIDLENCGDAVKANAQKLFDAQQGGNGGGGSNRRTLDQISTEMAADADREDKINEICRTAMGDHPTFREQITEMGKVAIANKNDPDKFELALIRATRSKAGQFRAHNAGTRNDPKVVEAALAMASFLPDIEKHYSAETLQQVDDNRLGQSFSIQQMLMQAAHQNGYSCRPGERVHAGNLAEVLEYALPPRGIRAHLSGGGMSTVSLPNILGNVANKQILAGYMEEDPSWREFAEIKPANNFYQQTHMRMLDNLEYEEVGPGGEIRHGTLNEETYTSQLKTVAKMLGLNRQQIINDDAGAFSDLRPRLGRGAAKKFLTSFWTAFLNNSAFFTAALTNYISGSTTNLGTDGVGLGLMVAAFRQMTSPTADGLKRVGQDLNPSKILVPPELEGNANINFKNQNLGSVANSSANIYQNRFRPVVQWRLSNSSFTGYSTTAYYMFGDDVKPMIVTFLNGQQAPTVQSTEADFDILGILFRGFHDFSCDKSEYLAGIKSKGAA